MAKYVDRYSKWLRWIAPEEFNDTDLFRIITFFVFHSPCPNLSSMGKQLSDYGWNSPWIKPFYLNKQLIQASTNQKLIFPANSYDKLEDTLEKSILNEPFPSDYETERIAVYNNENNQFLSIFYHIRNSLAHGRINMVDCNGECVFIFEDVVPNKKKNELKLSARMIIKKSTLLRWIDIIEGGEKEYS